jgi:uncharacterized protein
MYRLMPHRFVYKQLRQGWRRAASFLSHKVLHLDDSPHRIALGVAIGFFIAWTPLVGGHMALALILCTLLRGNKMAGISFVWVCNPLTMGPIYYSSYRVGCALMPGMSGGSGQWKQVLGRLFDDSLPIWTRLTELGSLSWDIAAPLCLGSTLDGLFMGVLAYAVTYRFVIHHRRKLAMQFHVAAPTLATSTVVPAVQEKGSCVG